MILEGIEETKRRKEFESTLPCQLSGFRMQSIEELRGRYWLEMKVGYVENTSAKERRETVEKRRRCDTPKLVRSNENLCVKPVLGLLIGEDEIEF